MTNLDPPKPKFRRRAQARPDEVLDAALDLFTKQGYAQTTVDQIAKLAGLSKGAVYLYFPSKKAILKGLVIRVTAPINGVIFDEIVLFKGDPRPLIGSFLKTVAQVLEVKRNRLVPIIIIHEAPSAPDIAKLYRDAVLDRAIIAITALLAQGVEGGFIREINPELTARSIIGPIIAHLILFETFGISPKGGLKMDQLVENHLSILFAGLEPIKGDIS